MGAGTPGAEQIRWDGDRKARRGFSESVLCTGKSNAQILAVARKLAADRPSTPILFTRLVQSAADLLRVEFPAQVMSYDSLGQMLIWGQPPDPDPNRRVGVVTAGTSDVPVAREAELTLAVEGISVVARYDVGVAGLHRLWEVWHDFARCDVLIVAAGMDGALASVVGGMAWQPVIAVPTSVGYGSHFHGMAPLLTMLNSCAEGLAVVNIDNGFGAARLATQMLRLKAKSSLPYEE